MNHLDIVYIISGKEIYGGCSSLEDVIAKMSFTIAFTQKKNLKI